MRMSSPPKTDTPAIDVQHLECGYDGRVVLKDVTFQVRSGEIFFVIGGSGCGKSTLLRNMMGIQTPLSGSVARLFSGVKGTLCFSRNAVVDPCGS